MANESYTATGAIGSYAIANGTYTDTGTTHNDKPVYKNENNVVLYYDQGKNGLFWDPHWVIGSAIDGVRWWHNVTIIGSWETGEVLLSDAGVISFTESQGSPSGRIWLRNNKIVVTSSGNPIICSECPCKGCPTIPAGSTLEFWATRTITRTMTNEYNHKGSLSGVEYDRHSLDVEYKDIISCSYVTEKDIPFKQPYFEEGSLQGSVDGVVRFYVGQNELYGEPCGTLTRSITVSGTGSSSRSDDGGLVVSAEWIATPSTGNYLRGICALRRVYRNGRCEWVMGIDGDNAADITDSPNYEILFNRAVNAQGTGIYEWDCTEGNEGFSLDTRPIHTYHSTFIDHALGTTPPTGTFSQSVSGTFNRAELDNLGIPISFDNTSFRKVNLESISPLEAKLTSNVEITTSLEYEYDETEFETVHRSGVGYEHIKDDISIEFLITPPEPLDCNCGL